MAKQRGPASHWPGQASGGARATMRLPGGGSACHHLSPVQTRNLNLIPHLPEDLFALADSSAAYEARCAFHIAAGVREFLLQASPEFLAQLRDARTPDPWKFGFAVVHFAGNIVIGLLVRSYPTQKRTLQ
jgi:hypothetical protein